MDEKEAKGIDQKETRYIVNKILQVGESMDPRLKPENNMGEEMQEPAKMVDPRDLKLFRQLMVEANA